MTERGLHEFVASLRRAGAAVRACRLFDIRHRPSVVSLAYAGPKTETPAGQSQIDALIARSAAEHGVPVELVRRVVKRESNFNPKARNRIYYGLMQIRHDTARSMGYQGSPSGLLDAETNLRYGVRYLRGAWMVADGNQDRAVRLYSSGYYYHAKRKGMLKEVGLRN